MSYELRIAIIATVTAIIWLKYVDQSSPFPLFGKHRNPEDIALYNRAVETFDAGEYEYALDLFYNLLDTDSTQFYGPSPRDYIARIITILVHERATGRRERS